MRQAYYKSSDVKGKWKQMNYWYADTTTLVPTCKYLTQSYQIPLASGQSLTALEFVIRCPVGFWNRKWS